MGKVDDGGPAARLSRFPLARIRITREDRSWKGTCGRIGETYVVWSKQEPEPTIAGTFKPYGSSAAAYMRDDFEVIPIGLRGLLTIILETPSAYRTWRFRRRIRRALSTRPAPREEGR